MLQIYVRLNDAFPVCKRGKGFLPILVALSFIYLPCSYLQQKNNQFTPILNKIVFFLLTHYSLSTTQLAIH